MESPISTDEDDARMAAEHAQQQAEQRAADDLYCGHVDDQGLSWTREFCPICFKLKYSTLITDTNT